MIGRYSGTKTENKNISLKDMHLGEKLQINGRTLICIHETKENKYFSFLEVLAMLPINKIDEYLKDNWRNKYILPGYIWNDVKEWFIPNEIEVFGEKIYSSDTNGFQFDYYKKEINRVKCDKEGHVVFWWERSPYTSYSTYFCIVYNSGTASYDGASNCYGVAPVFRV